MRFVLFAVMLAVVFAACQTPQHTKENWSQTIYVRTTYAYLGAGQVPHPLSYVEIDSGVRLEVLYLAISPGNHVFEFVLVNPGNVPVKVYVSNSPANRGQPLGKTPMRIRAPMTLVREISQGEEAEDGLDTAYFTIVRNSNSDRIMTCRVMASRDPTAGGMITSCKPQFDSVSD